MVKCKLCDKEAMNNDNLCKECHDNACADHDAEQDALQAEADAEMEARAEEQAAQQAECDAQAQYEHERGGPEY
jgi:hypothetical protein